MRGPEGERARQGLQQPGMRPQFRAPILQTVRHNSPQLSPIQAPRVSVHKFFNFFYLLQWLLQIRQRQIFQKLGQIRQYFK